MQYHWPSESHADPAASARRRRGVASAYAVIMRFERKMKIVNSFVVGDRVSRLVDGIVNRRRAGGWISKPAKCGETDGGLDAGTRTVFDFPDARFKIQTPRTQSSLNPAQQRHLTSPHTASSS